MNEFDLRMLAVLNETHNITKAAEQLFLTQSALSKRISALEQDLNITLLARTQQGVRFTPDGEKVLSYTSQAETLFQNMRNQLTLDKGIISSTLNLGVTNNYAQFCLTDVFIPFRLAYPHITTNIITNHSRKILAQLEDGILDVAIIRGEHHWSEKTVLLNTENICAIRCQDDKDKPLHSIPYIGRLTDNLLDRKITKWLHENDLITNQPGINVENIITCVSMVEHGLGWAIIPEIALHSFSGIVTPLVYKDGTPLLHHTYLVYSDRSRRLPQINAFIEMILSQFNL